MIVHNFVFRSLTKYENNFINMHFDINSVIDIIVKCLDRDRDYLS